MLGPAKTRIGVMRGPWPAGPVTADRFRRLAFGTAALVLPFRDPPLTAKGLAALDPLSGGRAAPAVGVGMSDPQEGEAAGARAGSSEAMLDQLAELAEPVIPELHTR